MEIYYGVGYCYECGKKSHLYSDIDVGKPLCKNCLNKSQLKLPKPPEPFMIHEGLFKNREIKS